MNEPIIIQVHNLTLNQKSYIYSLTTGATLDEINYVVAKHIKHLYTNAHLMSYETSILDFIYKPYNPDIL